MTIDYDPNTDAPNQQRRPQYAMDDAWTRDFLGRAAIGHVATHWDNQPFITPKNFWYDPERHAIYFHGALIGRLRANVERHPEVCFEACEVGRMLPSNTAMGFGVQFESAVAFGKIRIVDDPDEQRQALYALIAKHFPEMRPGHEYRPIQEDELLGTTVYAIDIESWSGKRNWKDRAAQSPDWKPLGG